MVFRIEERDEAGDAEAKAQIGGGSDGGEFATTIFKKLEMMGVCSFGMSHSQLQRLWDGFEGHFGVVVLFPAGIQGWQEFVEAVRSFLYRRMKLGDALVLMTAESHPEVEAFVTWNAKYFQGKTHLKVLTPDEFLRRKG